jgi:hypothetical protein
MVPYTLLVLFSPFSVFSVNMGWIKTKPSHATVCLTMANPPLFSVKETTAHISKKYGQYITSSKQVMLRTRLFLSVYLMANQQLSVAVLNCEVIDI